MVRLLPSAAALAAAFLGACGQSAEREAKPDIPAVLVVVQGLDEEGGIRARTFRPDSSGAAFFRGDSVVADARVVIDYLAPGTRVDFLNGKLTLDGKDTGIAATSRDSGVFVALLPLAERFGAYVRGVKTEGHMITLWRSDVLCRYAHGADRRAAVFLEAAERRLLHRCRPAIDVQVRRWRSAQPGESWSASLTLRKPLDSANAARLLERYDAAPYAAYGSVAGHQLIVRVAPDSASMQIFTRLRLSAVEALERTLCGLPGAVRGRANRDVARAQGRDADPFHPERHMLASAAQARSELARIRNHDTPIIYGFDVLATAGQLRRIAVDSHIGKFDPATRLDTTWIVSGADPGGVGLTIPADIAALDSTELSVRLRREADAVTGCSRKP